MTHQSNQIFATREQRAMGLDTFDVRALQKLARWRLNDGWMFHNGIRYDALAEDGFVTSDLRIASFTATSGNAVYKRAYHITEKGRAVLALSATATFTEVE